MRALLAVCLSVLASIAADPPPKELPEGRVLATKEPFVSGKVKLAVTSVKVDDGMAIISMKVYTDDDTAKIDYATMRQVGIRATDNFGNGYRKLKVLLGGAIPPANSVSKDKPVTDEFAIERPIKTVEFLDLDLPGPLVGQKDDIRFRIPREMWEPKKK